MLTILFLIFAFFGSFVSLDAMQPQGISQNLQFTQQLTEAVTSENIKALRALLIDALNEKNGAKIETILSFINYDEAYSLIISWIPDTDVPMADKIQIWLNFLYTFAPPQNEDDVEDFEPEQPGNNNPDSNTQSTFAPFTQIEQEDGL